MEPAFRRYIGIDYSGAATASTSLKGLRVYMAEADGPPTPGTHIFCTTNGGLDWKQTYVNADGDASLMDIASVSPTEYWAVGGEMGLFGPTGASFFQSTDAGVTWTQQNVTIPDQYAGEWSAPMGPRGSARRLPSPARPLDASRVCVACGGLMGAATCVCRRVCPYAPTPCTAVSIDCVYAGSNCLASMLDVLTQETSIASLK